MEVRRLLLFLFLATTAWSDAPNPLDDISKYVNLISTDAVKCSKTVTISSFSEDISIFFKHDDNPTLKWYDFYTAISCKFAEWTINEIFGFLSRTPLFYQKNYEKLPVFKKAFSSLFIKSVKNFVKIDENIGRFIRILHGFISKNSNATYYNDKTIVSALLSLRVKLHFILSNSKTKKSKRNKSPHTRIVQLIVEELNTLQSFSSMNCSTVQTFDDRNPQFTGYWITKIGNVTPGLQDRINDLLSSLEKINLESNQPICSVSHMLFVEFLLSNEFIQRDIAYARFKFPQTKSSSIASSSSQSTYVNKESIMLSQILQKIEVSQDIELVVLYQNFIITTIMKLALTKTEKLVLQNQIDLSEIRNLIKVVDSEIKKNTKQFPDLFVDGFKILNELINSNVENHSELEDYRRLLHTIEIDDELSLKDEISDKNYVQNLLEIILNRINDFKCFYQSIKCQITEHNKFYKTLIENNNIQYLEHGDKSILNEICNFIFNIYSICYEAVIYTNERIDRNIQNDNETILFQRIWKALETVLHYIHTVLKINKNHMYFFEMASKIAIVMVNFKKKSSAELKNYHAERIFNVVMTELNIFETKYCDHSKLNFLLINNINWINFGKGNLIVESFDKFIKSYYSTNATDSLLNNLDPKQSLEHFDVGYLNEKFIKPSSIVNRYEKYITFIWKGKKLNISKIYEDATSLVLDHEDLNELYGIYFNFFAATVYLEMKKILDDNKIKTIENKFGQSKKHLSNFSLNLFSNDMHSLIERINSLLNISSKTMTYSSLNKKKEKIEGHFKKYSMEIIKLNT